MEKVIVQDRTPAQIKEIVRENQDIRAKQEEISKEFKKILEYATNDPDGFADFLKKMNKQ
jgi:translation initiation factor 2 beta subunit (eIF-2beta)/eIF-5